MDKLNSANKEKQYLVSKSQHEILNKLDRITSNGNNAEVKRRKDGSLVILEVKKEVV